MRIPLIFFFTPDFAEMFLKYKWEAYNIYEGEIFDETKRSTRIKKSKVH